MQKRILGLASVASIMSASAGSTDHVMSGSERHLRGAKNAEVDFGGGGVTSIDNGFGGGAGGHLTSSVSIAAGDGGEDGITSESSSVTDGHIQRRIGHPNLSSKFVGAGV